jgi:FkbM family methyltransferase
MIAPVNLAGLTAELVLGLPGIYSARVLETLCHTKSQLGQDVFALSECNMKENGYFVEFGATDGVTLSNTHLLETKFGWNGIVAEPARRWHTALKANRRCYVETKCVWRKSGVTLPFREVTEEGELSTLDTFSFSDLHATSREHGKIYSVDTISLLDLLDKHNAPDFVDYLSVDTEGSEYEILIAFDFRRCQFGVITCEHNYGPNREKVHALLTGHGYVRKLESLSQFDDWYTPMSNHHPRPNDASSVAPGTVSTANRTVHDL